MQIMSATLTSALAELSDSERKRLENLRNEGVEQALLTVWSEDNDEVMRTLDSFAETKRNLD